VIPGAPESWTRDQQLALAWTMPRYRPVLRSLFMADAFFGHIALSTSDPMLARIKLAWWAEQGIESDMLDLHLSSEVNRQLRSLPESQTWLKANLEFWDHLIEPWPPDEPQISTYATARGSSLAQAVNMVTGGEVGAMQRPLARWAAQNLGRHTNTQSVRDLVDQYLAEVGDPDGRTVTPAPARVLARLANRMQKSRFPDVATAARGAIFDSIL
jgi:15-cis-phytoene synthase